MIVLKSNEFWGERSGTLNLKGERIFKLKKWANGINNSRTPSKKRSDYKNAKLHRLGRNG